MHKLFLKINNKIISKWFILLMDMAIVGLSFFLATFIRFNFSLTYFEPSYFKYNIFILVVLKAFLFVIFKSHTGVVRHTNLSDAIRLLYSNSIAAILLGIISFNIPNSVWDIPFSIIIIDFLLSLFGLIASRYIIKYIFKNLWNSFKTKKKVIIYGSGELGRLTRGILLNDTRQNFQILGFIDDNPQKKGLSVEGVKVVSKKNIFNLINKDQIDEVEIILAIQSLGVKEKDSMIEELIDLGFKVKVVPPIKQWINGQLSSQQIQTIKIEDILDRPSIQLNNRLVKSFVNNKRILITGAAGSIGSEIVRQLLSFEPDTLILLDQAESALYDLESEITRMKSKISLGTKLFFEVKDICNVSRMEKLFIEYDPEIVFHAAAYKHVPLMEKNPYKAVSVNTIGTANLAKLSSKYKVEKFVFISTDKAVNPTNVMGASKRAAEIYVQSLNRSHNNDTRFVVTRFGNVLGSNGSVIPLFKKQIASGGPVTVTDPEIIRYFMTIPEACQLVLEAGTMGKGGEIYVFDMGEPVKIYDLAVKMIKLSGFEPHSQIKIEFSGLRPGEKLFEELLTADETTIGTHHPKILISKVKFEEYEEIKTRFEKLEKELNTVSNDVIVRFLKDLIPEFSSNNSPFVKLDKEKPLEIPFK